MTILGYDLSYLELFASIFFIVSVILATRASIWNWPISIISQILFFFLFLQIKLYGNMTLQVFFTGVAVYGWYFWGKDEGKPIKKLGLGKFFTIGLLTFLISLIFGYFLKKLEGVEYPLLDASTTIFSVTAVFLLSRKYIEAWITWIIVDILNVILFGLKGINLISLEYIIITCFATYGLINWIKLYKNEKRISIR